MSDSTKRIQASFCRPDPIETTEDRRESRGSPPVDCAHRERKRAPRRFEQLLHFKGFAGGVPLNTETAAVNPRVGIAR
jgi:hypothetical protein